MHVNFDGPENTFCKNKFDTLFLPETPLKTLYIGKPCLNICQCDFIVKQTKNKERKFTGKRKD